MKALHSHALHGAASLIHPACIVSVAVLQTSMSNYFKIFLNYYFDCVFPNSNSSFSTIREKDQFEREREQERYVRSFIFIPSSNLNQLVKFYQVENFSCCKWHVLRQLSDRIAFTRIALHSPTSHGAASLVHPDESKISFPYQEITQF